MKIGIVIQARMKSQRFPGKVLKPLHGRPVIDHVVRSCQETRLPVIVATSDTRSDAAIVDWCVSHEVPCYRGSMCDVLGRMIGAAECHELDVIVRVCCDSPMIRPEWITYLCERWNDTDTYLAFSISGTPAVQLPIGLPELVSVKALKAVHHFARQMHEHVTSGFYSSFNPGYRLLPWSIDGPLPMTVDRPSDLERIAECFPQAATHG